LISWDNINWESYNIGSGFYHYPQELIFNNLETFWIINDKNEFGGITLFDINIKAKYHLSVSNNKLKSNNINSVTVDKNNYVWVGSDQGVFYYNYSSLDDVKQIGSYLTPNDGNKNIFQNIMINDILIDNSNNKWIGTDQGIFVFDSNKNKIINSFNKDNSPIPSDNIISLKTTESGEIFILTDYGLISYNTYNEMPKPNYSDLKIYPNPITISNDQSIIISGLVDKNIIHITNQSGRLVFSDVYQGGGLVWDLKDSDKIKISPGIYLVFILSEDGSRELIEKILVI
jgi:streptogramin lyase